MKDDAKVTSLTETYVTAGDGCRLFVRRREVDGPLGEVVIVHGFNEHSGRYDHVAGFFCSRGYNVTGYDHRGHGRSQGLAGDVPRFGLYEDDLALILSLVVPESRRKVFLLSHSMGGLIALRFLASPRAAVDGAVITAPLLGIAARVPFWKAAIGRTAWALWPRLRMPSRIDPASLSRDPSVGRAYAADPLVGQLVSARWFGELGNAIKEFNITAGQIGTPVLVMHGTSDRLASVEATKAAFHKISAPDKQLVLYPGYYHELLNEPEKRDVMQKCCDWIEARATGGHAPD